MPLPPCPYAPLPRLIGIRGNRQREVHAVVYDEKQLQKLRATRLPEEGIVENFDLLADLTVTREVLEQMAATLDVHAEKDTGSRFSIRLPAA